MDFEDLCGADDTDKNGIERSEQSNRFPISNIPDGDLLWLGTGSNFDNLSQIMNEFLDDSLSIYRAVPGFIKTVVITIMDNGEGNDVNIRIEDAGVGISDLNAAFTLAGIGRQRTYLNEHGFGLKNALSCANPTNDDWRVITRTPEDAFYDRCKVVSAPYRIGGGEFCGEYRKGWDGVLGNTGTIFEFRCAYGVFCSVINSVKEPKQRSFESVIDTLAEDLGFTYAGAIQNEEFHIQLLCPTISPEPRIVTPVVPTWDNDYDNKVGDCSLNLGDGDVKVHYEYGRISTSPTNRKHYVGNMDSSGAEIAINGRVIEYNIFKDIWKAERHPSQNHFLLQIDLKTDKPERLPKTRCTKNGFRQGDEKLEALYSWIRHMVPEPTKEISLTHSESELFDQLARYKNAHIREDKCVKREFPVYKAYGERLKVDLYVAENNYTTIYEGKRINSTPKDVYQLRMYWDGCCVDGIKPNKGILLASNHPSSVTKMIALMNQLKGPDGTKYFFEARTWQDECVD